MDIENELKELSQGVDEALEEFVKIKEKGVIRELFEILHNSETNNLIEQWIDMSIVLSMKNGYTTLSNPFDVNDQTMIVNGHHGIKDLILKGFVYGLYWKTKELEDAKLAKMWDVEDK